MLLGLVTLAEYAFGWRLGLDQLLFADRPGPHAPFPGRPSGTVALGFVLFGVAVVSCDAQVRGVWVAHVLAWVVAALGLTALVGYAIGEPSLSSLPSSQVIAVNAALGLVLLAVSVLLARPERGEIALLAAGGHAGLVLRRLLLVALCLPAGLAGLALLAQRARSSSGATGEWLTAIVATVVLVGMAWRTAAESGRSERADLERGRTAARLAAIANFSPEAIVGVGLDGRIESWNAAAERLYGISAAEAIGQPIDRLAPAEDPAWRERVLGAERGEVVRFSSHAVRTDGSTVAVAVAVGPVRDEGGAVHGISFLAQDVSERKTAEDERARLAQAADFATDAVLSVDLDGRVRRWNQGAERLYGFTAEEAMGRPLSELTLARDEPRENSARVLAGESGYTYEAPRRRKDGTIIETRTTIIPWRVDGRIVGTTGVTIDLTERKQAEQAAARLAAIVEASDDAIFRLAPDLTIQSFNPAAERLYGWSASEAVGQHVRILTAAGARPVNLQRVLAGEAIETETQGRRRDGRQIDVAATLSPIRSGGGVSGIACVVRDITDRTRIQHATARLAAIVESSTDAIFSVAGDGLVETWNAAAERLWGYTAPEVIGQPREMLWAPDWTQRYLDEVLAGAEVRVEGRGRRRDGTIFEFAIAASPVVIDGVPVAMSCICQDITARKGVERELARLAQAADYGSDAVVSMDLEQRICHWSPGAVRLYGFTEDEAVGRVLAELHPAGGWVRDSAAEVSDACRRVLAGAPSHEIETQRRRRDGAMMDVLVTYTPWRVDGRVVGVTTITTDITARKQHERAREQALRDLEEAQKVARLASWTWDSGSHTAAWSAQMYATFGRDPSCGPAVGGEFLQYIDPEDRAAIGAASTGALTGGRFFAGDLRVRAGDGAQRIVHAVARQDPQRPERYMGTIQDVTEQREAERALRQAEERFRLSFEEAPIGMALLSADGVLEHANTAFGVTCRRIRDELHGMKLWELIHPADTYTIADALRSLAAGKIDGVAHELRILPAAGAAVDVALHATVLRYGAGQPDRLLCQFQDITERKQYESRLQFMADHDPLTGLLNRRKFESELDRHVAHVKRYGSQGALLMLDIDHFKQVNDTLGHNAGDELIVSIAGVLKQRVRASDVLARLGGDEFAVLLPRADATEAAQVADALVRTVRENAALLGGQRHRVTTSIGITLFDAANDALTGESAMIDGDLAMYDAKDAGRDRYAFYTSSEQRTSRTKARLTWVSRIEHALQGERFTLAAQPILDLRTNQITQHELLLRMLDDHDDLIPPAAFLYIAERFELISRIDQWVLTHAIGLIEQHPHLRLHVNISGKSLGDQRLLHTIDERIRTSHIDPRQLIFEVTETAAVANITHAQTFAQNMRDHGCRFALDDFGAGFGSFYYLKHLPFDYVKIDGEFVQHALTGRVDQLVIDAVVRIAQGLGNETIAEFVTNEHTQRTVARLGVDHAQGYHIGHPIPIHELLAGTVSHHG